MLKIEEFASIINDKYDKRESMHHDLQTEVAEKVREVELKSMQRPFHSMSSSDTPKPMDPRYLKNNNAKLRCLWILRSIYCVATPLFPCPSKRMPKLQYDSFICFD